MESSGKVKVTDKNGYQRVLTTEEFIRMLKYEFNFSIADFENLHDSILSTQPTNPFEVN